MIIPQQFLTSIIWVALIHLNVITLLEPFGCGALHTQDIWLSAAHWPGKCNTAADKASRIFHDHTEWKLDSNIYVSITQALGAPSIDLFASRLNFQTKPYIAWHPDPGPFAIDAFSVDWGQHHFYAFPPFKGPVLAIMLCVPLLLFWFSQERGVHCY